MPGTIDYYLCYPLLRLPQAKLKLSVLQTVFHKTKTLGSQNAQNENGSEYLYHLCKQNHRRYMFD